MLPSHWSPVDNVQFVYKYVRRPINAKNPKMTPAFGTSVHYYASVCVSSSQIVWPADSHQPPRNHPTSLPTPTVTYSIAALAGIASRM